MYDGDKVKKVSGLGEPPMWQKTLLLPKGASPWKGEVGWDRVAYVS